MNIFNFFKKLFSIADQNDRKRRAESPPSLYDDLIPAKRHCSGLDKSEYHTPASMESKYVEDDDIQVVSECTSPRRHGKKLLNGINGDSQRAYNLRKSTSRMDSVSNPQSCQRANCKNSCVDYLVESSSSSFYPSTECTASTLSKTQRLREKKQYHDMLRDFIPSRIQILKSRGNNARLLKQTPEVIDLDKYDRQKNSTINHTPRAAPSSSSFFSTPQWQARNMFKQKCSTLSHESYSKENLDKNPSLSSTSMTVSETSSSEASSSVLIDQKKIMSNSLRDRLASKSVMSENFIPQVVKRHDSRFEERAKQAKELKRQAQILALKNRQARELSLEEQLLRTLRLCEPVLDETEDIEEEPLPELTPEMLQKVKNALVPHPANQELVQGFGLSITRKDIHTLSGLNWLNDEVINFYMNLLIARGSGDNFPKVHAMNTFFYPKLVSGGHASLKRWTRKVDIFSKAMLIVPIHLGIHWCMSIVDFRDKTIRYFDSMGGTNEKCLYTLRKYLQDESLDKKKQPYDVSDWKLICAKDIPQQMNGSDCGVFSCMFAEYMSANRKINFTQQDMPYFRNKMAYEILTSKLL